jgi:hypothetical protein
MLQAQAINSLASVLLKRFPVLGGTPAAHEEIEA